MAVSRFIIRLTSRGCWSHGHPTGQPSSRLAYSSRTAFIRRWDISGFSITSATSTPVNLTTLTISPSGATSAGSIVGDTYTFGDYLYSEALSDSAYARVEQTFMGDGVTDFNYVSGLLANTLGELANASSSFLFQQAFDSLVLPTRLRTSLITGPPFRAL